MARSEAQIITLVQQVLFDTGAAEWSAAEIRYFLNQGLRDLSHYSPRHVDEELGLNVEARTGSATSTLANNLVDATNAHFVAGDVNKVIYNTTDYTRAKIITYTSTTTVALSKDIMVSGEGYEIYNRECRNNKQVYVGDLANDVLLDVTENKIEYPIGSYRNFEPITVNVIEILTDDSPDTDYTKAYINFARIHKLPNLTDWAGAVNNASGYAAGSVSMAINLLGSDATIPEGAEFTITSVSGLYTVTEDATITTNAATISFYPGLDTAVINGQVITFTKSTLTPPLETLLANYVAGLCCLNITTEKIHESTWGDEVGKYRERGKELMSLAIGRLPQRRIHYRQYPRE